MFCLPVLTAIFFLLFSSLDYFPIQFGILVQCVFFSLISILFILVGSYRILLIIPI